jgi:hypothetical protein
MQNLQNLFAEYRKLLREVPLHLCGEAVPQRAYKSCDDVILPDLRIGGLVQTGSLSTETDETACSRLGSRYGFCGLPHRLRDRTIPINLHKRLLTLSAAFLPEAQPAVSVHRSVFRKKGVIHEILTPFPITLIQCYRTTHLQSIRRYPVARGCRGKKSPISHLKNSHYSLMPYLSIDHCQLVQNLYRPIFGWRANALACRKNGWHLSSAADRCRSYPNMSVASKHHPCRLP